VTFGATNAFVVTCRAFRASVLWVAGVSGSVFCAPVTQFSSCFWNGRKHCAVEVANEPSDSQQN